MERFSNFLINEERSFLGNRVGGVLSSLQSLQGDIENMGSRQLARLSEEIVNQIRKILHKTWSNKHHNQLKELQKVAVAIQKTIDERGDLKQVLPAAVATLSTLSGKLGVKVNNLNAPETQDDSDLSPEDFESTGEQPDFSHKQQVPSQGSATQPPMGDPSMGAQSPMGDPSMGMMTAPMM